MVAFGADRPEIHSREDTRAQQAKCELQKDITKMQTSAQTKLTSSPFLAGPVCRRASVAALAPAVRGRPGRSALVVRAEKPQVNYQSHGVELRRCLREPINLERSFVSVAAGRKQSWKSCIDCLILDYALLTLPVSQGISIQYVLIVLKFAMDEQVHNCIGAELP